MRSLLFLATGAAALAVGYGTAVAQSVGIEVYSGPRYGTYYYNEPYEVRPGPRVYGYYGDNRVIVEPQVIVRPGNCGEFHYWDGTRCADARVNPPYIK